MSIEAIEKRVWQVMEQYSRGKVPKSEVNRWLAKLNKISRERCQTLHRKALKILF